MRLILAPLALLVLLTACQGRQADQAPTDSPAARSLLAQLPPAYAKADLANGQLHFNLCKPCHTIVQGGPNMTGPNLYGLFGRKVASHPGFGYSAALQAKDWTWDAEHLDVWLKNPRQDVPGTRMTFYGIPDDEDRRDLIAYLKVASSGGPM
jgi:cytochrome c